MLPSENNDSASVDCVRKFERRLATWACYLIPVWMAAGLVGAVVFGKTLLFLQPAQPWSHVVSSKLGLAAGVAVAALPLAWRLMIRLQPMINRFWSGWMSTVVVAATVIVIGLAIQHPRGAFLVQETVKARAPQLNFVRNIIFQQQALESDRPKAKGKRVGLIGSSQTNLGIDSDLLSSKANCEVYKTCMPGMVPTQYAALARRFADQKPTHVVCWLSEFDFFRESTLPTVRLRWCSDRFNFRSLLGTLDTKQKFKNRGELADIGFAALCPVWKQRSVAQMGLFRFWWRFDQTNDAPVDEDERQVGGQLVNKEQGVENAKKNIKRTALVETNFAAFRHFANCVTQSGAKLIVIEGESHPDTMKAYSPAFRIENHSTLKQMAGEVGFDFIVAKARPQFDLDDWRDAVHLNQHGRDKLTRFIAQRIRLND